jgi:hypothetical protein
LKWSSFSWIKFRKYSVILFNHHKVKILFGYSWFKKIAHRYIFRKYKPKGQAW